MKFITTTTFTMLVNGRMGIPFHLVRGFIKVTNTTITFYYLCKIFGTFIHFMSTNKKSGIGINVTRDTHPDIPYLVFVNDRSVFCRETKRIARIINRFLITTTWLGHLVNFQKSKISSPKAWIKH